MTAPRTRPAPRSAAYAAVDLGGGSGRVMLGHVARDHLVLTEVHRFTNTPVEVDGILRWDVDLLRSQTLVGLARAVQAADAAGRRLAGIGVDTWGVDYGLLDERGVLLAPPRHHRATTQAMVERVHDLLPAAELYRETGVVPLPINTVYQLREDVDSGLARRAAHLLLMPDLFTYWLCGGIGAERTIASTTGLLTAGTDRWSGDVLAALDLPAAVLPPVVPSGSVAGRTTPEVTSRLGLAEPVAVHRVAAHDTASALAGIRATTAGRGAVSCGSWALAGVATTTPVLTGRALAQGFTNEAGAWGDALLLRNLNGLWLLRECQQQWSHGQGRPVALRALLAAATRAPAGRSLFDVGRSELLAPGDMPARIAALCREAGHAPPESRGEFVRAILESLAVAIRTAMREAGALTRTAVAELTLVGGATRNPLLCRIIADVCGLPLRIGAAEATSEGNLALQLLSAGEVSGPDEVAALLGAGGGRVVEPADPAAVPALLRPDREELP